MRLGAVDARVATQAVLGDAGHATTASRSAATAAPSTSASRSMSALERCSVMATSRPSSSSGYPGLTPSAAQRSITLCTGTASLSANSRTTGCSCQAVTPSSALSVSTAEGGPQTEIAPGSLLTGLPNNL